jgi:hypothetical protein
MVRKNSTKIQEIRELCKDPYFATILGTQILANYLLFFFLYNRCDIIESGVVSRGMVDAVLRKAKSHRSKHKSGRPGLLYEEEEKLLREWLLHDMREGKFHFISEITEKV